VFFVQVFASNDERQDFLNPAQHNIFCLIGLN